MPFDGTFRPAARQDGDVYCRECLLDHGTDADPLDTPTTPHVDTDRVTHDTSTLQAEIPILGCYCEDHDVLAVIYDDLDCIAGWLVVELESPDDTCMALTPVYALRRDRDRSKEYFQPANPNRDDAGQLSTNVANTVEQPPWADDYERVITLSENNAPRTCGGCGDPASLYLIGPYTFSCGSCRP